jgi:ubiquinone/menaquinone biosynthesis C-methylase UbiE
MSNPNNISASIYDIVTRPQKGPEVTNLELELVKTLVNPGDSILDVGVGTGRHAIPLAQIGYKVTGIDSSAEMLKVAKEKVTSLQLPVSSLNLIKADILTYNLQPTTYNLIILFWNSFNEICLTKEDAQILLNKLSKALKPNGKILMNMDKPEWMQDLTSFTNTYEHDGLTYELEWSIKDHDKTTNVTTSEEKIVVKNETGKIVKQTNSLITQRWWRKSEIQELCKKANLKLSEINVENINENYYLLSSVAR